MNSTENPGPISQFVLDQACEMIKRHEGWMSCAYNDADGESFEQHDLEQSGTVTIGYGFNISKSGVRLPMDLADEWLKRIVVDAAEQINEEHEFFCEAEVEEHVQIVILDMAYNLGINGFFKFKKTIDFIFNDNLKEAATEMLDSKWAKQVPKRAMELSKIMAGTDERFTEELEIARVGHETDRKIEILSAEVRQLIIENRVLKNQLAVIQA